jgi:hypothetical protein
MGVDPDNHFFRTTDARQTRWKISVKYRYASETSGLPTLANDGFHEGFRMPAYMNDGPGIELTS